MVRLEELRKKQGSDIDALKSEFEIDFHLDEKKAIDLNGVVDKKIYNVWGGAIYGHKIFTINGKDII